MKRNKIRMFGILLAGSIIAISLTGCGSQNSYDTGAYDKSYAVEPMDIGYAEAPVELAEESMADYDALDATDGTSGTESVAMEQKIVVTWSLNLDTERYDDAVQAIREQTGVLGGYIESESETTYSENDRYDSFVLRIPADMVQDMLNTIEESGTVTSRSQNSDNITLSYVDTESRLSALRTEQSALEELMEEASSVEDLITIRSELTNVNYEIESYESQIRAMDNDVDYTAMYVYVNEVKAETEIDGSVGTRIKENFRDSVYGIGNFFENLFVFVIGYILNIVIWIAVITGIVFAVRKLRQRQLQKKVQKAEKPKRWKPGKKKNNTVVNEVAVEPEQKEE